MTTLGIEINPQPALDDDAGLLLLRGYLDGGALHSDPRLGSFTIAEPPQLVEGQTFLFFIDRETPYAASSFLIQVGGASVIVNGPGQSYGIIKVPANPTQFIRVTAMDGGTSIKHFTLNELLP